MSQEDDRKFSPVAGPGGQEAWMKKPSQIKVKFHIGEPEWNSNQRHGYHITNEELERRIHILTGVVQALIDHISEKEGGQLSVIEVASMRSGDTFSLVELK